MAGKNPPERTRELSNFPYSVFWEEFDDSWESLPLNREFFPILEARFEAAEALGAPHHLTIGGGNVLAVLRPLEVDEFQKELLCLHLYWLAGIYLSREHSRFFKSGPEHVRRQMRAVTKASEKFGQALAGLSLEGSGLLALIHKDAPDTRGKPLSLTSMMNQALELARSADLMVRTIPRLRRGQRVDFLLGKWIWNSVRAFETRTGREICARQSDTVGRRPRLEGEDGKVLLSYLRLVSPKIKIGTIVRVIVERRHAEAAQPAF